MPNQYLQGVIQIPSGLTIIAITQANPMVITTSLDPVTQANTYITGQKVILSVPITFGMFQANKLSAQITNVNGNQITLNIDSSQFDPFVNPNNGTTATLAPNGSQNLEYNNSTGQVPFQSLNNLGN